MKNHPVSPRIITSRLELVAATPEIALAELTDQHLFSEYLDARIPEDWPPPLNDAHSMNWFYLYLNENPDAVGWAMWYFLLREGTKDKPIAIGNGGFKGKPMPDARVEIGYSIIEKYQRKGYCSEAVNGLVVWAFSHQEVNTIIAETYPELRGSKRVLERNGFEYAGEGSEEGVIRFEKRRESLQIKTST